MMSLKGHVNRNFVTQEMSKWIWSEFWKQNQKDTSAHQFRSHIKSSMKSNGQYTCGTVCVCVVCICVYVASTASTFNFICYIKRDVVKSCGGLCEYEVATPCVYLGIAYATQKLQVWLTTVHGRLFKWQLWIWWWLSVSSGKKWVWDFWSIIFIIYEDQPNCWIFVAISDKCFRGCLFET